MLPSPDLLARLISPPWTRRSTAQLRGRGRPRPWCRRGLCRRGRNDRRRAAGLIQECRCLCPGCFDEFTARAGYFRCGDHAGVRSEPYDGIGLQRSLSDNQRVARRKFLLNKSEMYWCSRTGAMSFFGDERQQYLFSSVEISLACNLIWQA